MPRAREMSGSPGRMRSPVTCWPTASARRLSIGVRRAQRACRGRRAEEGGFPMSDRLKRARSKEAESAFRSQCIRNRPLRLARGVELAAALTLSLSTPAFADSVRINDLVVAASISDAQREATIKSVRAFYDFWNTGDEALLKEAIAPNFTDHTLP